MDLNIVTFIFFALAVVVFIQLRNVLGRRTGNERRPFDPYAKSKAEPAAVEKTAALPPAAKNAPFAAIDAYAPAGSGLNEDLRAIGRADGSFAPQEFLTGAKAAYEMILTAFARGRRGDLQNLLAKNIYENFVTALEQRSAAGETVKFSFIGAERAEIVAAELEKGRARLTVSFKGEIISATYDKAGQLIDGDEQNIVVLKDRWIFARELASKSPDWLLVATEDEE
ncbi:MAG: calcium-binding protein [Candidatus Tokpelaia sp.]|nr:MAG: calcium-binding protein [Candidatus Tokpelaia sp.]KAA6206083.1 MAG: calcium-binding protein [Candidatus Tokpelaia sp.]